MTRASHPQLNAYYSERAALLSGLKLGALDTREARDLFDRYASDDDIWTIPAQIRVDDRPRAGDVPVGVRVYCPERPTGTPLVWMHGGGFAQGDLDMLEAQGVASELADRANAVVVSVDYRLVSDTVRFPGPVDDVLDAWKWARDSLGLEAPALGGASAGAALAVSAALRCRDQGQNVGALLLAYPFLHFPNPAPSDELARALAELPDILRLSPEVVSWLVRGYVGSISGVPAEAFPGAAVLEGLPRTTLIAAEIDDLRPSAELFAAQLAEVGVPVATHTAPGAPHGFLNRVPSAPGVDNALEVLAAALRQQPSDLSQESSR